jgi:lysophospholipase L1-like esterase
LRRSWGIIKGNQDCKIMLLWVGTNDTKVPTPIDIYEDNLRQIILSGRAHDMNVIVATIPELGFSPFYLNNKEYTRKYSESVLKLSKTLNYKVVDMSDMEKHLIDGVHFTHEGNLEIAERFAKVIIG